MGKTEQKLSKCSLTPILSPGSLTISASTSEWEAVCLATTVTSSTGAPQGTVLSPPFFALYTVDFQNNSQLCLIQKVSDDTAVVACVGAGGMTGTLLRTFWGGVTKTSWTKEMVLDFWHSAQPVIIEGAEVEMVESHKYLGLE